jgi:DNA uptake protein ComE-like DNA-binding protein
MTTRRGVLAVALATIVALSACSLLHRHHEQEPERPKPIDLNRASLRKIEELPGVTPSLARRIVDGRPYATPDDLVDRGILTHREFERIIDRVVVDDRGH